MRWCADEFRRVSEVAHLPLYLREASLARVVLNDGLCRSKSRGVAFISIRFQLLCITFIYHVCKLCVLIFSHDLFVSTNKDNRSFMPFCHQGHQILPLGSAHNLDGLLQRYLGGDKNNEIMRS